MENITYKSFSFKPFNAIRIFLYGFFVLLFLCAFLTKDFLLGLKYGTMGIVIIVIFYVLTSYTEVSKTGNTLSIIKLYDSKQIQNVKSAQTWWSYDFGIESPFINEGSHGNSAPISNKINCFLKLSAENEDVFLYEQIYLGAKFPNNHNYLPNQFIDKSRLYRIWDVDKCIQKLELSPLIKPNNKR